MEEKARFSDSLAFRLAIPLWILVAVIVGTGIYESLNKQRQSDQNLHMSTFDVPLLASMSELAEKVNAAYLAERSMLTLNVKSDEYVSIGVEHDSVLAAARNKTLQIEERLRGKQSHGKIADIQMSLQAWTETTREVFALRDLDTRMDRLLAIDLSGGDSALQFRELIDQIVAFKTSWIDGIQQSAQVSALATRNSVWYGGALGILSALFGSVVAILLPMWIVRRLCDITRRIDDICDGDGDLSRRLRTHHRDEISDISRAFNRFSGQLNEAMQQTARAAEVVASDAQDMARHNELLSDQTETQAENIRDASNALEEISKAISVSAQNAGQASKDASTNSNSASLGKSGIDATIQAMGELADSSQQITDITRVVEAIAFQTNILALNAAVEAARAGEQGRGFAVVATEVRGLAQRSTDAANDIKRLIDAASEGIVRSKTLAQESGNNLDTILVSARSVAETIGEISDSAGGQNQRVQEINATITHIRDTMGSTKEFVDKMAVTSKRLESQSGELMQVVNRYRARDAANDSSMSSDQPSPQFNRAI